MTLTMTRPGIQPMYACTVTVTQTDAGIYMSGFTYNIRQTRTAASSAWDAIQVK